MNVGVKRVIASRLFFTSVFVNNGFVIDFVGVCSMEVGRRCGGEPETGVDV